MYGFSLQVNVTLVKEHRPDMHFSAPGRPEIDVPSKIHARERVARLLSCVVPCSFTHVHR